MKIKQFRYAADNFGYLVYGTKSGMVIDGGAPEQIAAFARQKAIQIAWVTNTHMHGDHTPGNAALLSMTDAMFLDCSEIKNDRVIQIDGENLKIWHTPGHTMDSVCFVADDFMVTGDTLFNGTVGNCFSGDLEAFYKSLKRLMELPPDMKIFSGHDYFHESMREAKRIEPYNKHIDSAIKKYNSGCVVTTVADELKTNPYIRFNDPDMMNNLHGENMPTHTELDRFKSIMELY